jgi:hypothetical protein
MIPIGMKCMATYRDTAALNFLIILRISCHLLKSQEYVSYCMHSIIIELLDDSIKHHKDTLVLSVPSTASDEANTFSGYILIDTLHGLKQSLLARLETDTGEQ